MKVLFLKEYKVGEKRSSISPELIRKYNDLGYEVYAEKNIGTEASFKDDIFTENGANITKITKTVIALADIIVKINPLEDTDIDILSSCKKSAIIIAATSSTKNIKKIAELGLSFFVPNLFPRISRAQAIDVLSSQSNLAGYRAVIDAAYESSKVLPMMMTSAGTVSPAKIMIIGAGVAGLQAIATAKRLGAIVTAFDSRAAAKEQVESLGAKFIEVKVAQSAEYEDKGGYATESSEEYKKKQKEALFENIINQDIVITTALLPNAPAPKLIDKNILENMKNGAVIIDMAAIGGGNCTETVRGKTIIKYGVKIIGNENIVSQSATDASRLYAKNIFNFITLLTNGDKKEININLEDQIIENSLVAHNGQSIK